MADQNEIQKLTKDSVYEAIFKRIYDGTYTPGTHLTEEILASEFHTSRTPIREVLHRLADLRLVRIVRNKGAEVIGLTFDDIEELYDIRKVLEIFALDAAIPNVRLQDLRDLRSKVEALGADSDLQTIVQTDYELHEYIVEASHRRHLKELLMQIVGLVQHVRYMAFDDPAGIDRANEEHLRLIDALFRRDGEEARTILADHIEKSKSIALSYLLHNRS